MEETLILSEIWHKNAQEETNVYEYCHHYKGVKSLAKQLHDIASLVPYFVWSSGLQGVLN